MQNLGIRGRILVGFLIVGLLMIAIAGMGYMAIERVAHHAAGLAGPDGTAPDTGEAAPAEFRRAAAAARMLLLAVGALGVTLCVLFGVLLGRVLEAPVGRAADLLEQLANGNAPPERMPIPAGLPPEDSLARLTGALNRLLDLRATADQPRTASAPGDAEPS